MWTIYHNNRCSKSRAALTFLEENNINFTPVYYLEVGLDSATILALHKQVGGDFDQLIRKKEAEFKVIADKWATFSLEEKVAYIVQYPKILERPIVSNGKKAVVARPTIEPIKTLLKDR